MIPAMEAVRIVLGAYTASFRVPHFVGYQLTLPVPPLSTIYGIISAATGQWVSPGFVAWLAYRLEYEAKGMDVETIVQIEREKETSTPRPRKPPETVTIIRREFLVMPRLFLYLPPEWGEVFRRPRYTLLLGRTQDVATVEALDRVVLESVKSGVAKGVLLPFELLSRNRVAALLCNLPVAFTNGPSRRPIRSQIFGAVDAHLPRLPDVQDANGWLVRDGTEDIVMPLFRREWVLYGDRGTTGEVEFQ